MRLILLASAVALTACDNTPVAEVNATGSVTSAEAPGTNQMVAAPAAVGTPDFIRRAAIGDLFEIESARVALQRSRIAEVRRYAEQMVTEHTTTTERLAGIVSSANLPAPPVALDEPHQRRLSDLKSAAADDFDGLYLDQQAQAHAEALDLLNGYAAGGESAELKAMAAETAPKVQQHLATVRRMDQGGVDDRAEARGAGAR